MTRMLNGPVFWLLLAIAFMPLVLTIGPGLETRHFPVFSKFDFVSVTEVAPGRSEVVVAFDKLRDCDPAGYAWYIGRRGEGQFSELTVQSTSNGNSYGRPVGRQVSLPFQVNASPDQLKDVFVDVFSRCPFQPWTTKSEVYP